MVWLPFAGYRDFDDCVRRNQDKRDPEAYCAEIQRRVENGHVLTTDMVLKKWVRDENGQFSEVPDWSPTMTPEEAEKWSADSALSMPLYHGTTSAAAEAITESGFDPTKSGSGGTQVYGAGLYLTADNMAAQNFANSRGGEMIETRVAVDSYVTADDPEMLAAQRLQSAYGVVSQLKQTGLGSADMEEQFKQKAKEQLSQPLDASDIAEYNLPEGTTGADVLEQVGVSEKEIDAALEASAKHSGSGHWLASSFLQNRGYEAAVVGDTEKPDEVVIFDPKNMTVVQDKNTVGKDALRTFSGSSYTDCNWTHNRSKGSDMAELTAPMVFKDDEKQIVYGPVLVPDEPDSDGDVVTEKQIEKVAHGFLKEYGNVDLQHSLNNVGSTVESYIAPMELQFENNVSVPKGSWMLGVHVNDDNVWSDVKKGKLTGFSIMGISSAVEKSAEKQESTRTTLADLGEDFIVNAVSLVGEPAVPKAKWIAVKNKKPGVVRPPTQETVDKAVAGSLEERRQLLQQAVWGKFESGYGDLMADIRATTENTVVIELYDMRSSESRTIQIGYEIADDGTVTFTGEPQDVRIEENVVPVNEPSSQNPLDSVLASREKPEGESFSAKMKRFFGGSTEKAGRSISDKNYEDLKKAKQVIDNLLGIAENERSGKSKEDDMDANEVRQIIKEELAAQKEAEQPAAASEKEAEATDAEKTAESTEESAKEAPEAPVQQEAEVEKEAPAKESSEKEADSEQLDKALEQLTTKSQSFSKKISGQDRFGEEAEKSSRPARDAFGFKVKE